MIENRSEIQQNSLVSKHEFQLKPCHRPVSRESQEATSQAVASDRKRRNKQEERAVFEGEGDKKTIGENRDRKKKLLFDRPILMV